MYRDALPVIAGDFFKATDRTRVAGKNVLQGKIIH
jgi:hypothetical protein